MVIKDQMKKKKCFESVKFQHTQLHKTEGQHTKLTHSYSIYYISLKFGLHTVQTVPTESKTTFYGSITNNQQTQKSNFM